MSRNGYKPAGFYFLARLRPNAGKYSFEACKVWVLLLTFVAYALFHASRKPLSIVKNALIADGNLPEPNVTVASSLTWPLNLVFVMKPLSSHSDHSLQKGWQPFNGKQGAALLGQVDLAFLASYAVGIFIAGHMGDRVCLRLLLSYGMVGSGIFVVLFGCAYWWKLHWLCYFLSVQIVCGLFQATGWPSVISIVSNWFGKSKRGLIMGVWNAHTSVGNICGTLMASAMLQYGWGWSFLVPGVAISVGGMLVFLLLPISPEDAGFPPALHELLQDKVQQLDGEKGYLNAHDTEFAKPLDDDRKCQPLIEKESNGLGPSGMAIESPAVSFFHAWAIPRVAPFAFCLFFSKLVAYTFLYWLPFYIRHTEIDGHYLSEATAGNLSTVFDVGGTVGGILAGHLSDKLNARAMVAATFTYASLPALALFRIYGNKSLWLNLALLFLAGISINGPYALITTAVSADLGTRETLKGSSRSLATVTAIIDGTGSVGAALGPLLTGYLSKAGWNSVFGMLSLSSTVAGLLLTGLVLEESREYATAMKVARLKSSQIDLV